MSEMLSLGAEFPEPTSEEWRELAEKALKGKSIDTLVTTTLDGIEIAPLYTKDDIAHRPGVPGVAPFTRGSRPVGEWAVRQLHGTPGPAAANDAILVDLERGVTEILLDADSIGIDSLADLAATLDGVMLDLAPIAFVPSVRWRLRADLLGQLWEQRGVPPTARLGSLGADPFKALARHGGLESSLDDELASLAELAGRYRGTEVRAVTVDTIPYGQAGSSDSFELACSLSTGVAYLRAMTAAGLSIDEAAGQIEFMITATADQFQTIAKFRAARRVWARVVEASGGTGSSAAAIQNAVTAPSMYAARDPWVNMLRSTVACFAAGIGGAASVTVLPFDHAIGVADDFARRCARNTQLLLLEESNLARVSDAAGGSWYVESLTDALAEVTWGEFQSIEAAGGMAAFLIDGKATAAIAATWAERADRLSRKIDPLTGVSEFPNIDETRLTRPSRPEPAKLDDPAVRIEPLPVRRPAGLFEALGDRAAALDPLPTIFLANLGPIATHTARATWSMNFFEVAGIRTLGNDGFETADEVAAAFSESGARLAVVCSSDDRYADDVAAVAPALRGAGAERIYLAGHPRAQRDAFTAAGIDDFVYVGCDSVAILERALDHLERGTA